jgi:hypothetical protein
MDKGATYMHHLHRCVLRGLPGEFEEYQRVTTEANFRAIMPLGVDADWGDE